MNKIFPSAAAALAGVVHDGQLMAVGGFGLCGIPEALIEALRDSRVKDLTVISNNAGVDGFGVGTLVAEGKEAREFDGHMHIMERALVPEVSLVKAQKADKSGNLVFRRTARNFNPAVAMAGKVTIVEVEEIVETGSIDPDAVHLPGIYVHRIVLNAHPEKRIEKRTLRAAATVAAPGTPAAEAAKEAVDAIAKAADKKKAGA